MGELSRECDIPVKIVPLGDVGVGKTMLVRTLTGASFNAGRYGCSIGCDFRICNVKGCRLQLWDIPGMEQFGYSRMFLRNAKVGMLCFDLSNSDEDTWAGLERRLKEARNVHDESNMMFIVVGCKQDLKKRVPQSILDYARRNGMEYFEVSSKTGFGQPELLSRLAFLGQFGKIHLFRSKRASGAAETLRDGWMQSDRTLFGHLIPRDIINILCCEIESNAALDERWGLPRDPHIAQPAKNTAKSSISWGIVGLTALAAALLGFLVYE